MDSNLKNNNSSPDITILINSCDIYKDAWEPFIRLFYSMERLSVSYCY